MARPTTPSKIKLDSVFVIPPGAEDIFVYTRDSEGINANNVYGPDTGGGSAAQVISGGTAPAATDNTLLPPTFSIVSQIVRTASGGQQVVDVVFEITEVAGATGYDIEVVKI